MKLATYRDSLGNVSLGALLENETILDLRSSQKLTAGTDSREFASMLALIDGGQPALDRVNELIHIQPEEAIQDVQSITLLAPIPVPPRLRDAGMFIEHFEIVGKYAARMIASNAPDPSAAFDELIASGKFDLPEAMQRRPLYYNCNHQSVIGPGQPVMWPSDCRVIDYELELGIVIGRGGSMIPEDTAEDYVFGYTLFNDWSARDIQIDTMPAGVGPTMGKDFANSIGPCIVTKDEIPDLYDLELTASVNGEVWSRGFTRNIHHRLPAVISQFSRISPLVAGEIIGSGTPAYGSGVEQDKFLKLGDEVTLSTPLIGALTNRIMERNS